MRYEKPHLTYPEQVARLRHRGVRITDEAAAVELLQAVGYYRLSAYVYPFRLPLPADRRRPGHTRSEELRPGVTLDHVQALWEFDRRLRLLVLAASETIEIGLRARMAYVLGRRHPFGHVTPGALDAGRCARERVIKGQRRQAFDLWRSRYGELCKRAAREPFVMHHATTYPESPLPVWVAVEILDFGAATRLYDLLRDDDRNEIARTLGFRSGATAAKVLLVVSNTRNVAAHHGRLWNRPPVSVPPRIHDSEVGPDLRGWLGLRRSRLHARLLLLAYTVRQIDPSSTWPGEMRAHLQAFPDLPGLCVEEDMGAPAGWERLPVWQTTRA